MIIHTIIRKETIIDKENTESPMTIEDPVIINF